MFELNKVSGYIGLILVAITLLAGIYYNYESIVYCKDINATYTNYTQTYQLAQEEYSKCIAEYNKSIALYESGCESYTMYNLNLTEKDFGIRGIYYKPDFYCVYTKNWNVSDIVYAQNHEIAHVLVSQDYEHFCK